MKSNLIIKLDATKGLLISEMLSKFPRQFLKVNRSLLYKLFSNQTEERKMMCGKKKSVPSLSSQKSVLDYTDAGTSPNTGGK